ncbi:MAG TPA: di-trans,poly-cis-decaprenylcistransferase [Candidatus Pacebacteria bacterium]|nr:di-trans,poly-cis-decaprenylcistransferase [Candidatus Paceibacterota bacterium]
MDNTQEIPNHVAIIPDGNRRWARARDVEPWDGHAAGADIIEELTKKARDIGIKYISFWGSSEENMKRRSLRERRELIKIYEKYFNKLMSGDDIFDDEVRINVFGKWREQLPKSLVSIIEEGIEKTKNHKKHHLTFFLSYSGDEEMMGAIEKIVKSYEKGVKITKEIIKKHLLTSDLPAVDYLIRTGGEPHLSTGFMMWDIANAQLFFSDEYFPDFGCEEFEKAIEEYVKRTRRLGA